MRGTAGFTLAELLIAIILVSMIVLGFAAIFSAVYRFEVQGYQKDIIQGGAIGSLYSLDRDIGVTTHVTFPPPPCRVSTWPTVVCSGSTPQDDDVLVGCTNLDGIPFIPIPYLGLHLLDSTKPMMIYQYCVDPGGNMIYTWRNLAAPLLCGGLPCCGPSVACGTPIGGGTNLVTLATGVGHDPAPAPNGPYPNYFRRPAYQNDAIELHYTVGTGTAAVVINTTVRAMKSLNPGAP